MLIEKNGPSPISFIPQKLVDQTEPRAALPFGKSEANVRDVTCVTRPELLLSVYCYLMSLTPLQANIIILFVLLAVPY